MEYKDYYRILGLKRSATRDDIRRAYRKLTRRYHPDVSSDPDAEKRFKEVGEAYEVLRDPEKRAAYDQLGADRKAGQEFRRPFREPESFSFRGGGFTRGDVESYSDFFGSLFGREGWTGERRRTAYSARGDDFQARMQIDLEDSFRGGTRAVTLEIPEEDAQGRIRMRERTLHVSVPKGITGGQQIRVVGQGGPGIGGGEAGDLFLEVEFKPHPLYRIEGRDLYLDLPVAPWEAALGATVTVPSPAGAVNLKIPPGSAAGRKLLLRGRGLPGHPPGDIYAVLQIALPPADNPQATELYRRMERELKFNPRTGSGWT